MKTKWLDLVLRLTNRIYATKSHILAQSGFVAIGNILVLVVLEALLAVISLPLYVGLNSRKVVAFMQEKGGYSRMTFDYNFRRILTLTGLSVILVVWIIKLLFIVLLPSVYDPMSLYSVSELRPVEVLTSEVIEDETGIQVARIDETLRVPELKGVEKNGGDGFVFSGVGDPFSTVVLFLSDRQTAVYSTTVDSSGNWEIEHLQDNFKLREGNHSILVFAYNKELGTKSNVSPEQYFKVTTHWIDNVAQNIDLIMNWLIILIIAFGIFLIVLTV